MSTHISPHDKYFKTMMEYPEVSYSFIQDNLPSPLLSRIDLSSLTLVKESMIEDSLRTQFTDLLFKAHFAPIASLEDEKSSQIQAFDKSLEEGLIYILIEHASRPDKLLPFRLWKYTCGLLDRHLKTNPKGPFPLIFPMILHSGKSPYSHSTDFFSLFGDNEHIVRNIFTNPFTLRDLASKPDEELSTHLKLRFVESTMKHIWTKKWDAFFKPLFNDFVDSIPNEEIAFILPSLYYIFHNKKMNHREWSLCLKDLASSSTSKEKETTIMNMEECFEQRGILKGKLEGMREGKREGKLEGKLEERLEIATRLLHKGHSLDHVADLLDLSLEEMKMLNHPTH